MPSLKDLRGRINSVKSTRKITSAMKMVAASKLRRAQSQAEAARPYAERMEGMLSRLAAATRGSPDAPRLLAGSGREQVHLVVPVTADRGLAGAFNSSIGRATRTLVRRLEAEGKTVKLLPVGRKGRDYLRREFADRIVHDVSYAGIKRIEFAQARELASRITDMFGHGEFDVCTVVFNRFVSVISQVPTEMQLIPLPVPEAHEAETKVARPIYEFEPGEEDDTRPPAAAEHGDTAVSRAAGERGGGAGGAHEQHGQRDAQRRGHDQPADAELQPDAAGQHHQGADRDHLRGGGGLRQSRASPWQEAPPPAPPPGGSASWTSAGD